MPPEGRGAFLCGRASHRLSKAALPEVDATCFWEFVVRVTEQPGWARERQALTEVEKS